jgi:MGT family glycosyltransferase
MSHFLLTSTPIYGHVAPMLTVGRGLVSRGHQVTMLTGRKYRGAVESHAMTFRPLPDEVDYDDANLDAWLPGRKQFRGLAAGRYDIIGLFIRPLHSQYYAFTDALASESYDAVVSETAFLGVLPVLLSVPAGYRIPIAGVSATPLSVISVDCAPFGSGIDPGRSPHTRRRNRLLNTVLQRGPLKPIQDALDDALAGLGLPGTTANYFDQVTKFDVTFHLAVSAFEYPRRELPPTVRFVGPLRSTDPETACLPPWWADLECSRPIVHVTQGTMDNIDFGKLLVPALHGLATENLLVVASTGGRPVSTLLERLGGPLPSNARVDTFVPYDQLLPHTDVMITNGGFGGVQRALSFGVPLVVAGTTEDKPEVAGRVAWSGTGINLRTGTPSPGRLRRAVRSALADPRYRIEAARLRREIIAAGDPLVTVADTMESLMSGNAGLVVSDGILDEGEPVLAVR